MVPNKMKDTDLVTDNLEKTNVEQDTLGNKQLLKQILQQLQYVMIPRVPLGLL